MELKRRATREDKERSRSKSPQHQPRRRDIRDEPTHYDYPPDSRGDIYIPGKGYVMQPNNTVH